MAVNTIIVMIYPHTFVYFLYFYIAQIQYPLVSNHPLNSPHNQIKRTMTKIRQLAY